MKVVTTQELIDFINAQPADRLVDMTNSSDNERCGCVMVHYGKEVLGIEEDFGCGFYSWEDDYESFTFASIADDTKITDITNTVVSDWYSTINTYGDLQKRMKLKIP